MAIPASPTDDTTKSSELDGTASLVKRYAAVRDFTNRLARPLSFEDCMIQSMPDASPTRWHLAHTTWFFETFILATLSEYKTFDERFRYLFNSYYNAVGEQFPRSQRGLISRPGMQATLDYRCHVDAAIRELLESGSAHEQHLRAIEIGLHHEQQHQELILTDIKHALSCNPMMPIYEESSLPAGSVASDDWMVFPEGLFEVGHGGGSFGFDNEFPRHRVFLHDFSLASRCVTAGEFMEFMDDGGYERPDHWLSMGWDTVRQNDWSAPLYWVNQDGIWKMFTLAGLVPVDENWPVCHVSYFEADAYARWAGYRLPTEFEWEQACHSRSTSGLTNKKEANSRQALQFADHLTERGQAIHPTGQDCSNNMLGGVWEWTSSSYAAYPGYAPPGGALGEYNGKFMCNQYVLRGGSVASSSTHIRPTYRNFFPPTARWQFSGFRLAR
jgi:ergothioneine biosynthesis protein EgtB